MGYNEQIILQNNLKENVSELESWPGIRLVSLGPKAEPPDLSSKNIRRRAISPYPSRYYSDSFG